MFLFMEESSRLLSPVMQLEEPVRQDMQFYYVGDHTWATMLGQSVKLQPVVLQSLSELERARLREVALYHLEKCFSISIPREIRKRRKSLRRKFDSFSKDKKERDMAPKAFGIPLSQVIANDRAHKQRQDALKESRRDCLELEASVLHFRAEKRQQNEGRKLRGPASSLELHGQLQSHTLLDSTPRVHRRGGLSVDSISDLVESQSRLLEALQLSHPNELELKKTAGRVQAKLSLNPIYQQVPRVVERCCRHICTYGLQTVGIFRVGSSKKRVKQLREDFDLGADVILDEEHSVHDVAALLKEFLRDMPDPLLPCELYLAFLHTTTLKEDEQLAYLQLLLYLLPPCNCDTLLQLLTLLHTVQGHADDTQGPDGQVQGNKMTAGNLAVIFGPNLLQGERGSEREGTAQSLGIEDSAAIISITLQLLQNHQQLFMVSAEHQQEVLMSLIQTDPDVIDYLLRRKLSSCHPTVEADSESRVQDPKISMDLAVSSSEDLPSLENSPCFSGLQGDNSLSSEVFLNVLCLGQNMKRSSEDGMMKTISSMRQFHSHQNLMSLDDTPSPLGEQACGGGATHGNLEQDVPEASVWVRQDAVAHHSLPPPTNFWDFFTGKVSGSETIV